MVVFCWDNSIMTVNLKMWQIIAFTTIQTLEYSKGYTHALSYSKADTEDSASSTLSPSLPCSPPPAVDAWKPALLLAILPKKPAGSRTAEADLSTRVWTGTEGSKKRLMRAGKVGCQITQEKEQHVLDCAARQGRHSQDRTHRDAYDEKGFVVKCKSN